MATKKDQEKKDVYVIHTDKCMIHMKANEWDTDIDIDSLCQIQYYNLFGEMVTAPALLNKVGLLRADAEAKVKEERLGLKVFEAQKLSYHSKQLIQLGISKPTVSATESAVTEDPEVIAFRKKVIQEEKNYAYIDAMYWAVRDKCEKLNHLLKPVTPDELFDDLMNGVVNTITITKLKKNL